MLTHKPLLYDDLHAKQGGFCAECGLELTDRYHTHLDRIIPGKDGGIYVPENCRLICLKCEWSTEETTPDSRYPEVRAVYNSYLFWQNEYRSTQRRLMAYDGDIKGTTASPYVTADVREELICHMFHSQDKCKAAEKALRAVVRTTPEWMGFMADAPGMSELTAGFLLSHIDIRKADNVSSLWNFFGFTPQDSAGAKGRNPGKGQLRSALWAALGIFVIRKNTEYRRVYDNYRGKDGDKMGDKPARFRCIKLWLSHLWNQWRQFEELPVTVPYANNHLGHDGFYDPEQFGW